MPIRREHPKMGLKKCVADLGEGDLKGKRVLTRVHLNAPMDDDNILLDSRIRDALPTINHLIQHGARVILATHLGRPKGPKHDWKGEPLEPRLSELWQVEGVTPEYSLQPLVPRLSELLGVEVKMAKDCFGQDVDKLVNETPEGGVLLLENLKFYLEEDQSDDDFAEKLASCADLFVNEAFRISHRTQASTAIIPYSWKEKAFRSRFMREKVLTISKPAVAGLLMRKELDYLIGAVKNPTKPFAAIVGGSKLSTKIHLIESLLENVGLLLLGGGIIFTFYKANGYSVGSSRVEEINLAESLIKKAKEKGVRLVLPVDVEIADRYGAKANRKVVPVDEIHDIPAGWLGLDIGPDTIKSFGEELDTAKTILWNGPMGVFEKNFAAGTKAIANKLAELTEKGVTTIIAGGDTVVAVTKVGLAGKMSHISKGGDASLELLEGKKLPGVLYLDDA